MWSHVTSQQDLGSSGLIGMWGNEFTSHDLSRICSLGEVTTLLIARKERFHLSVITDASPQWTHFLSNSTIYYLIAITYSDRITAENDIFFPLLHFTSDDSPLWILSYQRIWDAECEMNMTIANSNQMVSVPTFLHYIKEYLKNCKNQQIPAFSPHSVPHSMKTPLYLSYTKPLAENESLHCNFMLPRCRAPFWRAHVMFVGTWIMIAYTLQEAVLYPLSTGVKAAE